MTSFNLSYPTWQHFHDNGSGTLGRVDNISEVEIVVKVLPCGNERLNDSGHLHVLMYAATK